MSDPRANTASIADRVHPVTAGAPVVVSDIAAHREVGDPYAIFADPIDGPAWVGALESLVDEGSEFRRDRIARRHPLHDGVHRGQHDQRLVASLQAR